MHTLKLLASLLLIAPIAIAQNGQIAISQRPGVVPWTPAQLPNLGSWFRADLKVFQAVNGTIAATTSNSSPTAYWDSVNSGSLAPVTQATALLQPTWFNGGSNGFPYLRFRTNYLFNASSGFSTPMAFWAVVSWPGFGPVGGDIVISQVNQAMLLGFSSQQSPTELGRAFHYDGLLAYTTNSFVTNQIVLLVANNASTSATGKTVWMNGQQGTNGASQTFSFQNASIGGTAASSAYFTGDMYEWGWVNGAIMTVQDRTNLQNYVRYRYAVTNVTMLGP